MRRPQRVRLRTNQSGGSGQRIRRLDSREQMIEGRAKRIDIALWRRTQILNLFKRRVTRRVAKNTSAGFVVFMIVPSGFREAKIEQTNLARRGDFQVVRFDVP